MAKHNESKPRVPGGRKTKGVEWCMCGRCNHRWHRPYHVDDSRGPRMDTFSGDLMPQPPKVGCPNCGSKYNVRAMMDYSVSKEDIKKIPNLDPLDGREIPDYIAS